MDRINVYTSDTLHQQISLLCVTFTSKEEQHTSAVKADDIVIQHSPKRTSWGFGSAPPLPPSAFAMRGGGRSNIGGDSNIGGGYCGGSCGYGGGRRSFGGHGGGGGGRGHGFGGGRGSGGATMAAAVGGRNNVGGILAHSGGGGYGGGCQQKSPPPMGPTNEIGITVSTAGSDQKRRAVTSVVEHMSLDGGDGDGLDNDEDSVYHTQYVGGNGSNEYDDL